MLDNQLTAVNRNGSLIAVEMPRGLLPVGSVSILDAKGHVVLGVGRPIALPSDVLEGLAATEDAAVSGVLDDAGLGRVQAVTSVVRGRDDRNPETGKRLTLRRLIVRLQ